MASRVQIELRGVTKAYEARGQRVVALGGIDLDIREREFISLIGHSGCGKTTLMKIIGGLVAPSGGEVRIDGKSPAAALRDRAFGFVFQDPTLLPWRKVLGNASLLHEIIDPAGVKPERYRELLATVGLAGFENAYPGELSGGMKQRVALVRALAFDPAILLMDEPFAALDVMTRDKMGAELLRIWNGRKTVIFVTHSISEAVFLSDRVVVMDRRPGRIRRVVEVNLGRPRLPGVRETAEFVEYVRDLRQELDAAEGEAVG